MKDLTRSIRKVETDFDKIKVDVDLKGDKKEMSKLFDKFNEFEKHTTNMLNLLDSRNKQSKENMLNDYKHMQKKLSQKYEIDLKKKEEKNKTNTGGIFNFLKKHDIDNKPEGEKTEEKSDQEEKPEEKPEEIKQAEEPKKAEGSNEEVITASPQQQEQQNKQE